MMKMKEPEIAAAVYLVHKLQERHYDSASDFIKGYLLRNQSSFAKYGQQHSQI
jgi:hypothetical protein